MVRKQGIWLGTGNMVRKQGIWYKETGNMVRKQGILLGNREYG